MVNGRLQRPSKHENSDPDAHHAKLIAPEPDERARERFRTDRCRPIFTNMAGVSRLTGPQPFRRMLAAWIDARLRDDAMEAPKRSAFALRIVGQLIAQDLDVRPIGASLREAMGHDLPLGQALGLAPGLLIRFHRLPPAETLIHP